MNLWRFIVVCLLVVLFQTYPLAQVHSTLRIEHLTGDFYVYTTYKNLDGFEFPSNGMYLVTPDGVVLIDTPWDTTQFQPLFDSISKKHGAQVVMVLSTHYHDDRTAGLAYFRSKGIPTYSSQLTYELCELHGENQSEYFFINDTTLNVGSYSFETFYPGEGHTKDNIVVWFPGHKILYGGCLVKSTENTGLGNVADANIDVWAPSIQKLIERYPNPAFVIPGHFAWKSNQSLRHTLDLLENVKK